MKRILSALLLLLSAPALAQEHAIVPEAPITLPAREVDHSHRFSIVPPTDWQDYVPRDDSFLAWRAPTGRTATSPFQATLRVSELRDLRLDVAVLATHLKPFFDKMMPHWQLAGEGFELLDGRKSYFIGVRQPECGCEDLQYYLPTVDQRYFLITFHAPIADAKAYAPLFREVARSVRLLD